MFLKIREVDKELTFIKYDEIKIIELGHAEEERAWKVLKIHLVIPSNYIRGYEKCEKFLISTSNGDVDFICDQIDKYNDWKLRDGSNLKDIKKDEEYLG